MKEDVKTILDIQDLDMKMIRLMRVRKERQHEINQINTLYKELGQQATQKEKEIEGLNTQGLRYTDDINKLKQQLAALQASSSSTIADLQTQLKKKEGVVVDMQKERDRLLAEVTDAERIMRSTPGISL